jgi:hypothetical protein
LAAEIAHAQADAAARDLETLEAELDGNEGSSEGR